MPLGQNVTEHVCMQRSFVDLIQSILSRNEIIDRVTRVR